MKSAIVILNWNTRDLLSRFLPPLLKSIESHDAEVVVADNGSIDGSVALLEHDFPQVRRITFDENYGFTGGYNRALKEIEAEYYILMNSDIEVCDDWLSPLEKWMDSHENCAACAPKLLSYYDHNSFEYAGAAGGRIDMLGYPFCRGRVMKRLEKDYGQYDSPIEVFWASGACLMVRKSCWEESGGLDERFFAHMEEIDLCWRLQLRGYSICVVPQSKVYHLGGATLPNDSPWKLKLNFRNNLLMLENNLAMSYIAQGNGVSASLRKSRRLIWFRMILDGAAAASYLLKGKTDCFKSVIEAHKEFRQYGKRNRLAELLLWKEEFAQRVHLKGIYPGSMVLTSIINGGKVFSKLDKATLKKDKLR